MNSRLTINVGLRYDFYSNPTEAFGRESSFPNPATDSAPVVGKLFARTPKDLLSPQAGFAWNVFGDGKTVVRSGFGIYRDQLSSIVFGIERLLPPFFGVEEFIFPQFLNPQNAAQTQSLDASVVTYNPKFPYAMEYNLNVEREIAQGIILSAGYFGARGNHLTREAEENPFEPALGHRYNPNLASPLAADLTDGQSFYNSFQVSVSKRYAHSLSWQLSYTLAHSVDDASVDSSVESVNDPQTSQNIFNRKGSRGPSDFDIRDNFVANVVYDLPGRGRMLAAGRSPLLPAFTAACRSPRYSPSTMLTYNRWILQSVRTSSAIPTRVSVRTAPEWALHRVGLTRGHLRYRRPVSLAMPDEISCGVRPLRSLMRRCTKTLRSRNDGRLRLEWKLITSSTIRILAFPVIHKVRSRWEATGMPSSRMRRAISPLTQAKS